MKSKGIIKKEDLRRNKHVSDFIKAHKQTRLAFARSEENQTSTPQVKKHVVKLPDSRNSSSSNYKQPRVSAVKELLKTRKRKVLVKKYSQTLLLKAEKDVQAKKANNKETTPGQQKIVRTVTRAGREPPTASAWGAMTILSVEPDSKTYDISGHMVDILEKQAVSKIERLRCELAIRLQQVNARVDKALGQIGLSRWDVIPSEENMAVYAATKHFEERERRDKFLQNLHDQLFDGSERMRIIEELYEWFMLTRGFVMDDVKTEQELMAQEDTIDKVAANIDAAMINTVYTIGKMKRLGQKLLVSGGYVDTLGRRRQPPVLINEQTLISDYGNNLDAALGVVRKCHEELSKIVKSPLLKIWVVSARKQMKSLAAAIVKAYVDYVKLQKSSFDQHHKLTTLTGTLATKDTNLNNIQKQLKVAKNVIIEQKQDLKKMDSMLASAHDRTKYYEDKLMKLTSDYQKVTNSLYSNKDSVKDSNALKAAIEKNLRANNDVSGQTREMEAQTLNNGRESGVPEGLVMVEKAVFNQLQNEVTLLRAKLKRIEQSNERSQSRATTSVSQPRMSDVTSIESESSDDLFQLVDSVRRSISSGKVLSHSERKIALTLKLLDGQIKRLKEDNEVYQDRITELQGQVEAANLELKQRGKHMEDLQGQIMRDFAIHLPKKRKMHKQYDEGLRNTQEMLKHVMEAISDIFYDNRRMSSYVRNRIDSQFPGSLSTWVSKAKEPLALQAVKTEEDLMDVASTYESVESLDLDTGGRASPDPDSLQPRGKSDITSVGSATANENGSLRLADIVDAKRRKKSKANRKNLAPNQNVGVEKTEKSKSAGNVGVKVKPMKRRLDVGKSLSFGEDKTHASTDWDEENSQIPVHQDSHTAALNKVEYRTPKNRSEVSMKSLHVTEEDEYGAEDTVGLNEQTSHDSVHKTSKELKQTASRNEVESTQEYESVASDEEVTDTRHSLEYSSDPEGGRSSRRPLKEGRSVKWSVLLSKTNSSTSSSHHSTTFENLIEWTDNFIAGVPLNDDDESDDQKYSHRDGKSEVVTSNNSKSEVAEPRGNMRQVKSRKNDTTETNKQGDAKPKIKKQVVKKFIEGKSKLKKYSDVGPIPEIKYDKDSMPYSDDTIGEKEDNNYSTPQTIQYDRQSVQQPELGRVSDSTLATTISYSKRSLDRKPNGRTDIKDVEYGASDVVYSEDDLTVSYHPREDHFEANYDNLQTSKRVAEEVDDAEDIQPTIVSLGPVHTKSQLSDVDSRPRKVEKVPSSRSESRKPVQSVRSISATKHSRISGGEKSKSPAKLVEEIYTEFEAGLLPEVSKNAARVVSKKWVAMKDKITMLLKAVKSQVQLSTKKYREEAELHQKKSKQLRLSLTNTQELLQGVQTEKHSLQEKLTVSEDNLKHISLEVAERRHREEVKCKNISQELEFFRHEYELCQAELRRMNDEHEERLKASDEMLRDIASRRQHYDRITNLHKHLIGRLESYMIKNNMASSLSPNVVPLGDEEQSRRVERVKQLCRSSIQNKEFKRMLDNLTNHFSGMSMSKYQVEEFIHQYIVLPNSGNMDFLSLQALQQNSLLNQKSGTILQVINDFNKKMSEHVRVIVSKLDSYNGTGQFGSSSPEPSGPDGEKRVVGRRYEGEIRKELLGHATKFLADSFNVSRSVQHRPTVRNTHHPQRATTTKPPPPLVTGVSFKSNGPEIFWLRDKSVVKNKGDWSEANEDYQLHLDAKWTELDYKNRYKYHGVKGLKHHQRLKGVRGYTVDETIIPLPFADKPPSRPKPDPLKPSCYGIANCEKDMPFTSQRNTAIVCKTLNFVD